jgi:hypothetical protein
MAAITVRFEDHRGTPGTGVAGGEGTRRVGTFAMRDLSDTEFAVVLRAVLGEVSERRNALSASDKDLADTVSAMASVASADGEISGAQLVHFMSGVMASGGLSDDEVGALYQITREELRTRAPSSFVHVPDNGISSTYVCDGLAEGDRVILPNGKKGILKKIILDDTGGDCATYTYVVKPDGTRDDEYGDSAIPKTSRVVSRIADDVRSLLHRAKKIMDDATDPAGKPTQLRWDMSPIVVRLSIIVDGEAQSKEVP